MRAKRHPHHHRHHAPGGAEHGASHQHNPQGRFGRGAGRGQSHAAPAADAAGEHGGRPGARGQRGERGHRCPHRAPHRTQGSGDRPPARPLCLDLRRFPGTPRTDQPLRPGQRTHHLGRDAAGTRRLVRGSGPVRQRWPQRLRLHLLPRQRHGQQPRMAPDRKRLARLLRPLDQPAGTQGADALEHLFRPAGGARRAAAAEQSLPAMESEAKAGSPR